MSRVMRRRELAKAAGFKLKKVKNKYVLSSALSVKADTFYGKTAGERDDTVLYLICSMRRWSYNKKLRGAK